ncbi:MAG: 2-hydroxyacid dehydrogenase [Gammaproteobacteria bacterium]
MSAVSKPQNEILMVGAHLAPVIDRLEPEIRVHRYWDAADQPALLRHIAPRVRAIATDAFTGASADLMAALPRLELVANFGVGYDAIDAVYAHQHGITITNTPDVLNDDVADLAMALMLAVLRRIPEADRYVRASRWLEQPFPLAQKLTGKRLGIYGLGRIGKALARRAAGFDLQIGYHGRHQQPGQSQSGQSYQYFDSLLALASWCDILVVLVPETPETRGTVNARVLAALGRYGVLVNVARGGIVDEPALIEALTSATLGGAGLDVYVQEPAVPPALFKLDNVVLLPHLGSATVDTRAAMADLVVRNLQAWFRGDSLLTPVAKPD